MAAKFMETGEMGFCPVCGTTSAVVVLPDDRLQKRIARLMESQLFAHYPELGSAPGDTLQFCYTWIETITEHGHEFSLKELLAGIQVVLALAAEALGELNNEDIDLMRNALEYLEAGHD